MMGDSCKLVIKLQTALGKFQSILFPLSHITILGILQSYHTNDRFNFNCDPKPSDFIRQLCYNNYISTVTKPHGLILRNVVAITFSILYACWIGFAIYGTVTLRKRPGHGKNKNTKKFLCIYFIHVFFRILFLGVMLGLVCSYQTIILPSVFKCDVNEILQTKSQTTPSPLNQTKIKLQCNDLHHEEKSNLNIAVIIVDASFMVVSILEVLHLYCIRENYLQKLVGDHEGDCELQEFLQNEYDPTEMINNIRQLYENREGWLAPFPWCEDFHFSFDKIYTRLKVIYKKKTRGTVTDRVVTMPEIFNQHEECEEPRVVLIEGKPGMGKTTCCKKVVFDWATGKHATGNCFTNFVIVLLIKCRDVQSGLWEAIEDQLLPREVGEDERKRFFDFICHNQSNVLLVLDGLDEVSEKKLSMFSQIIQGRVLPNCRVVVTARHEAGVKVRKYCDALLEVEGFTKEDVQSFIRKYFRDKPKLAEQLNRHLFLDYKLFEISTNPLNTALLCLVYEDLNGVFPESRTKLYMEIVECVLRRYRTKQQLPENDEDLVDLYESQLKHLGSIALKGLLEDNLDFDEKELREHKASDLPGLGFLSVQPGGSKRRPTRHYGFLHKTFQEFFAAFYLSYQLIKKEISTNSIAADRKYRHELKEVLLFTFGMLAARYQETAVNLLKSIATQLNQEEKEGATVLLECVKECRKENKIIDEKLASALGASLQIETVALSEKEVDETLAVFLSNCLKTNTTVTTFALTDSWVDGVKALGECLKYNTSLTTLDLNSNGIDNNGAAALGECLRCNTSLRTLNLNGNEIGDDGAVALGECLKYNKSLTTLNLSSNKIGDDGAAALSECLKYNTSLTTLILNDNGIGGHGAASLGQSLKYKTSLTTLDLGSTKIGDHVAALGECLKCNTSLKTLNLENTGIGDDGAAALGECLKCSTSLTTLYLDNNGIGDDGAAALGQCLKYNTSLTAWNLTCNKIGDKGAAALGEFLKGNTSLTTLHLDVNGIGADGAAALGECLKYNTSVTTLNLTGNVIGDDGAAALGECLKDNTSLTTLNFVANGIGGDGATALGQCLKYNTSLTTLNLNSNRVGSSGAAALGECLKHNTSLTTLILSYNEIGDDGATSLGECLKENNVLTLLDLYGNRIDDGGTAALTAAQECHPSLKFIIRL